MAQMECIYCGEGKTGVERTKMFGAWTKRYRHCVKCKGKFATVEVDEDVLKKVLESNNEEETQKKLGEFAAAIRKAKKNNKKGKKVNA